MATLTEDATTAERIAKLEEWKDYHHELALVESMELRSLVRQVTKLNYKFWAVVIVTGADVGLRIFETFGG